jgi:CheY-like chemotaxis protein
MNDETPRPLHILLVEDDPDHAELTLLALAEHDPRHRTEHVADGEAALDYLFGRGDHVGSGRPDLVLLDLNLPRRGGLEVLAELKGHPELRLIPVVVLTTSDAETDRTRAYGSYANSYIVKPVNFDKFGAMIRELGDYWARWNRLP